METTTDEERMEHLDEAECWGRLAGAQIGRLAFEGPRGIEIVPVNVALRGRTLLFRTEPGAAMLTPQRRPVAFEVDGWTSRTAWSVIAHGELRRAREQDPLVADAEAGVHPWAPEEDEPRTVVVELVVDRVSGRQFPRGARHDIPWYW